MQKRGMGRWMGWQPRLEEKKEEKPEFLRSPIVTPSKPLHNITLASRLPHTSSTLAAGWALAERAGAGRWGLGELAGLKRLPFQHHARSLRLKIRKQAVRFARERGWSQAAPGRGATSRRDARRRGLAKVPYDARRGYKRAPRKTRSVVVRRMTA